jgi:RHS repeat-associated protein
LTATAYPATSNENYAYDSVGNRTSSQRSASYGYQPNNRLTTTDTAGYLYDNNGNMISKSDGAGTTQLQWDFENRLTQVVTPSAGSVTYKYDALGRRIQRAPSTGVSTNFTYDGDDVAQDKTSTNVITEYLNGPGIDNKIRQKVGTVLNYFAQDHLGSTTALTDANGALLERETYDAYGNSAGSARTRYGFTGRERDGVTGLMYYRARWYDEQIGRFISEDPIGLGGGMNQFAYVGNNPENGMDPSGLYEIDVHYYLTYYLALRTGCFSDAQARLIGEYDQLTDDDDDHAPGPMRSGRNVDFHAFGTPAQNASRQNELWRLATQGQGSLSNLGIFFHFFQDSYAHRDFAGNANIGHGKAGHSPDHTNGDTNKAMDMAKATWDKLTEFGRAKGLCCHAQNPDWGKVGAFIGIGYDLATEEGRSNDYWHEISDDQLRAKIGILGVPWRSQNGRLRP